MSPDGASRRNGAVVLGGGRLPRTVHPVLTPGCLGINITWHIVRARAEGIGGPSDQQQEQRSHQQFDDQWCKHPS
jgi:hypothetical protein